MRIAGSIILGVIGAILYFAVTVDVAGISLSTVGVILMVAAAIWFIVELVQGMGQQEVARKAVENRGGNNPQAPQGSNPQAPQGNNSQAAQDPQNPGGGQQ